MKSLKINPSTLKYLCIKNDIFKIRYLFVEIRDEVFVYIYRKEYWLKKQLEQHLSLILDVYLLKVNGNKSNPIMVKDFKCSGIEEN